MRRGFKTKTIKRKKMVGEQLKESRLAQGLELPQIEDKIQIRAKFLAALEANKFESLAAPVYVAGFLRKYAGFLGLNPATIVAQYNEQRQILKSLKKGNESFSPPSRISQFRFIITPKVLFITVVFLTALGMFGYIFSEIKSFAAAPSLEILEPLSETVTRSELLVVAGRTDESAALTINQQPITLEPGGQFRAEVKLMEGVNKIEVMAKSRTQKETRKNIVILKE